jgi:hypothetical protein
MKLWKLPWPHWDPSAITDSVSHWQWSVCISVTSSWARSPEPHRIRLRAETGSVYGHCNAAGGLAEWCPKIHKLERVRVSMASRGRGRKVSHSAEEQAWEWNLEATWQTQHSRLALLRASVLGSGLTNPGINTAMKRVHEKPDPCWNDRSLGALVFFKWLLFWIWMFRKKSILAVAIFKFVIKPTSEI